VRVKGLIVVAVPLMALVATTLASLALQSSERSERTAANADFTFISADNQVLTDALNAETGVSAIPVAVLSAEASPRVIRRLLASGALAYLTKPLVLAELDELLRSFAVPGTSVQPPTPITRPPA
jgi:CheY-like chemotaxis protein